jgi:hypothetical protein
VVAGILLRRCAILLLLAPAHLRHMVAPTRHDMKGARRSIFRPVAVIASQRPASIDRRQPAGTITPVSI